MNWALTQIEDTRPLPGIDWQIDVDVQKAGRYGADVATVGAMVQLVTRGILLDTMRVDSSDEEVEIRVRMPEEYRLLSTLDTLKVRTSDGLVPCQTLSHASPLKNWPKSIASIKSGISTSRQAWHRTQNALSLMKTAKKAMSSSTPMNVSNI